MTVYASCNQGNTREDEPVAFYFSFASFLIFFSALPESFLSTFLRLML
jgi:hypothetical protein